MLEKTLGIFLAILILLAAFGVHKHVRQAFKLVRIPPRLQKLKASEPWVIDGVEIVQSKIFKRLIVFTLKAVVLTLLSLAALFKIGALTAKNLRKK